MDATTTRPAEGPDGRRRPEPAAGERLGRTRRSACLRGWRLLLVVFVALDAIALAGWRGPSAAGNSAASSDSSLVGPPRAAATGPSGAQAAPVGIDIPSIGVHAAMVDLHLQADGSLAVPTDFATTGWWADGTRPGAVGPAIIVGHVDSYKAAAVFYRLRDLQPGAEVTVRRGDGSAVIFVTQAVKQYAKDALPADAIYGPTDVAALRLITCGGPFDRRHRRYVDNVVAFAQLAAPAHPTSGGRP